MKIRNLKRNLLPEISRENTRVRNFKNNLILKDLKISGTFVEQSTPSSHILIRANKEKSEVEISGKREDIEMIQKIALSLRKNAVSAFTQYKARQPLPNIPCIYPIFVTTLVRKFYIATINFQPRQKRGKEVELPTVPLLLESLPEGSLVILVTELGFGSLFEEKYSNKANEKKIHMFIVETDSDHNIGKTRAEIEVFTATLFKFKFLSVTLSKIFAPGNS